MNGSKRVLTVILALLTVAPIVLSGCKSEKDGADTTAPIETEAPTDTGADLENVEPIPDVPNTEDSTMITGSELLTLIRNGTIAENGDYAVTDGSYLVFDRKDDGKSYDLKNAIIRIGVRDGEAGIAFKNTRTISLSNARIAAYGGTAVDTDKARNCTLSKLHVTGNVSTAFSLGGKDVKLDGCTVAPEDGGKIETAMLALGTNVTVTNCNVKGVSIGVKDSSENGAVIENNLISDCSVGVLTEVANTTVWYNTVKGGDFGVKATDTKSQISAGEATVYNILVAMNDISGIASCVTYENVSNGVILRNTLDNADVSGCTYAYVNENAVKGKLTLKKNNYVIANGNECGRLDATENANVNGDDVTDLSARVQTGANDALLPHVNSEQFVGMTRKTVVRDAETSRDLKTYLSEALAEKDTVIVPPGAYVNLAMTFNGVSDKTVYAYGVLSEMAESTGKGNAITFQSCSDVTLKGLFLGNTLYPHSQGTVTYKKVEGGLKVIQFIADPGYHSNITTSDGNFVDNPAGHYFKAGDTTAMCDITSYGSVSYNVSTKVNTVSGISEPIYQNIQKDDRIAFRSGTGDGGIFMLECTEMKLEDVTVNSCASFAECDKNNDVAPVLHRFAVVKGPAPLLDSGKNYDDPNGVIWTDAYGRKRSAEPLYTTCDATHSTSARTGIQVISSLLENMNDDGGNVNGYYGLVHSYNSSSKTLVYTTCDVRNYHLVPQPFAVGDDLMLFTMSGEYVGEAKVTVATEALGDDKYSIVLDKSVTLPVGEDIVVQNFSANGRGFLFDNVKVRNSGANGVRVKAPGGEVKNCTFDNVRCSGVSCVPEYQDWPEVGYAKDLKILNCVFDGLGRSQSLWEDWNNRAAYAAIVIRYHFGDDSQLSYETGENSSSVKYCMHSNIEISGNVFKNRYSRYEISVSAVQNLKITNNTFEAAQASASVTSTKAPILVLGGNGIELSGNTFYQGVTAPIENRENHAKNITGDNMN